MQVANAYNAKWDFIQIKIGSVYNNVIKNVLLAVELHKIIVLFVLMGQGDLEIFCNNVNALMGIMMMVVKIVSLVKLRDVKFVILKESVFNV